MNRALIALAVLGLIYAVHKGKKMIEVEGIRGYRNRNPMNIKKTSINWNGKIQDGTDPVFEQFADHSDGIRAGAKLLANYERLYGINTVSGLINRYAPPEDNNPTGDYVMYVSKKVGVAPGQAINVRANLIPLTKAIIGFELGSVPYSDGYIADSIADVVA